MHWLNWVIDLLPFCFFGISLGGSSSSSTSPVTETTSGTNSPITRGGSQTVMPGSIGVGAGKYLETGALDVSNSTAPNVGGLTVGKGATVTIGDTNALDTISSIANEFTQAISNFAASTPATITSALGGQSNAPLGSNISTNMVYLVLAVIGAVVALVGLRKKS